MGSIETSCGHPSYGSLTDLASEDGLQQAMSSSLFSAVDRIDVSLKLKIKPHINVKNEVRLETDLQIEDVVQIDPVTSTPQTAIRSSQNVVVVDDQETVVTSGLMRDRLTDGETKIPLLGDLPIVGWLFRQKHVVKTKVNLLVVMTPYIVRDRSDYRRILQRKMQEHEEFAAAYYGHRREYRAHIDYSRKMGPLATLAQTVGRETRRLENGGEGDGSEEMIGPNVVGK